MDRDAEITIVRRAYANQIMASVSAVDARVEQAFAAILRERFLDPGPWPPNSGYVA